MIPTHRRRSLAMAFREWRKYPNRAGFCIDQNGSPVWLRPGETALPGDVLLGAYAEAGASWSPAMVQRLLDDRRPVAVSSMGEPCNDWTVA